MNKEETCLQTLEQSLCLVMVSGVGGVALWNNKRKAEGVENEPCYYTGHDVDDFKYGKPLL